jgi:hypothetical protein
LKIFSAIDKKRGYPRSGESKGKSTRKEGRNTKPPSKLRKKRHA